MNLIERLKNVLGTFKVNFRFGSSEIGGKMYKIFEHTLYIHLCDSPRLPGYLTAAVHPSILPHILCYICAQIHGSSAGLGGEAWSTGGLGGEGSKPTSHLT